MLNIIEELDYFKNKLNVVDNSENLNDFLERESRQYKLKFIKKLSSIEKKLDEAEESLESSKTENENIILSMLSVLENIEYMLDFYKEDLETVEKIKKLKSEVYKGFNAIGVNEVNPVIGSKVDNILHNPIEALEKEGFNSYEIIEVLEVGYKYKEKVLKEAKVIAAK